VNAAEGAKACPANGKLKIFIKACQSSMVGFGQLEGDSPGTMETLVKGKSDVCGHLLEQAVEPIVRDDPRLVDLSCPDKKKQGWLTTGDDSHEGYIGPVYGFGVVLGDYFEDPVLIVQWA